MAMSNTLNFNLIDADNQNAIYITDGTTQDHSFLEITNTCGEPLWIRGLQEPGLFHFSLRFRPGTLIEAVWKEKSNEEENSDEKSSEEKGKSHKAKKISPISLLGINVHNHSEIKTDVVKMERHTPENRINSISFRFTEDLKLEPEEKIVFVLSNLIASAQGGARGTRVELRHDNIYLKDDFPLSGSNLQYINIVNRRGEKHIPLVADFVGGNEILNDGSFNSLVLSLRTAGRSKLSVYGGDNPEDVQSGNKKEAATKFKILFDCADSEVGKSWHLMQTNDAKAVQISDITNMQESAAIAPKIKQRFQDKVIISYFPEWGIYNPGFLPGHIPADQLSVVLYAFINLNGKFELSIDDPWGATQKGFDYGEDEKRKKYFQEADPNSNQAGIFEQLKKIKKEHPKLKYQISVGGWSLSSRFSSLIDVKKRQTFINSARTFLKDHPIFDGIDIDWEFPGKYRPEEVEGLNAHRVENKGQTNEKKVRETKKINLGNLVSCKNISDEELPEVVQKIRAAILNQESVAQSDDELVEAIHEIRDGKSYSPLSTWLTEYDGACFIGNFVHYKGGLLFYDYPIFRKLLMQSFEIERTDGFQVFKDALKSEDRQNLYNISPQENYQPSKKEKEKDAKNAKLNLERYKINYRTLSGKSFFNKKKDQKDIKFLENTGEIFYLFEKENLSDEEIKKSKIIGQVVYDKVRYYFDEKGDVYRSIDGETFFTLMKELRESLESSCLITSAIYTTREGIHAIDYGKCKDYMDYIYMMSYDYSGPWNDRTGHHSALYNSDPLIDDDHCVAAGVDELLSQGVPPNQIVIGAAAYGKSFGGMTDLGENGDYLYAKTKADWEERSGGPYSRQAATLDYGEICELDKTGYNNHGKGKITGYVKEWDSDARAHYFYNKETGHFITYDSQEGVDAKVEFLIKNKLGGIMTWDMSTDCYNSNHDPDEKSLLVQMHSSLNKHTPEKKGYDSDDWYIEQNVQAKSAQWTITSKHTNSDISGEILKLAFNKIKTTFPNGQANIYVYYENIPGYWDGIFIEKIAKTPLLIRQANIAVGTGNADAKLHIVQNEKVDPGGVIIETEAGSMATPLVIKAGKESEMGRPEKFKVDGDGNVTVHGKLALAGREKQPDIDDLKQYIDDSMPVGSIVIWSGDETDIPNKWRLCNGLAYNASGNAVRFQLTDKSLEMLSGNAELDPYMNKLKALKGIEYESNDSLFDALGWETGEKLQKHYREIGKAALLQGKETPQNVHRWTPNLKAKFVVGAGNYWEYDSKVEISVEKKYKAGEKGGSNSLSLAEENTPPHKHFMEVSVDESNTLRVPIKWADGQAFTKNFINYVKGEKDARTSGFPMKPVPPEGNKQVADPFDNRPAYYALCYIMKVV